MGKKKRPRCHNCIHAGIQFKVTDLTYVHCEDEAQYPKEKWQSGELSPWDTLMKFSDTCQHHVFKPQPSETIN